MLLQIIDEMHTGAGGAGVFVFRNHPSRKSGTSIRISKYQRCFQIGIERVMGMLAHLAHLSGKTGTVRSVGGTLGYP